MPKIVNHSEYKEEILKDCFDLFARKGFGEVTMREIAKELKISTGTLYHYFPTKESIFREMIKYLSEKKVLQFAERVPKTSSVEERIQSMFQYIVNNESFFQNVLFLIIDYYRQNGFQDPENFIRETINYFKSSITEQIGLQDQVLVNVVFSYILGLITHQLIRSGLESKEEEVDMFRKMIEIFSLSSEGTSQSGGKII
ncbi:MAG: TetR/AcrR family transcriptional regulator [Leptospiraceae bacterium]|nr:TetR/AcrR family transcriptional regulator [Leptospiraceae bacterium]MCP5496465.1 TetR/AcrR family transcriptional regulator [Leptospiraceae bacterium]